MSNNEEVGSDADEDFIDVEGVAIPAGAALMTIKEKQKYVPDLYSAGLSWKQIEEVLALNPKFIGQALKAGHVEKRRPPQKDTEKAVTTPKKNNTVPASGGGCFGTSPLPDVDVIASKSKARQAAPHSQPIRALDESYARMIGTMTGRVDWFMEALTRVGWSSMLIAFQSASIDPNEAFDRLEQFENPDEFVQFVNMYLQALWQAKTDAQALVKMEEQVRNQDLLLFAAGERIKQLDAAFAKAVLTARTALTSMNSDDLRKFALASTFATLTTSTSGNGWEQER